MNTAGFSPITPSNRLAEPYAEAVAWYILETIIEKSTLSVHKPTEIKSGGR
jgi:hypothetical protein